MNEIIRSIIIGGVQGVSEFFPISSSGHLVLIPYIFNWNYQGLDFDIALHFGTAVALLVYFWRDWVDLIKNAFGIGSGKSNDDGKGYPKNLLWQIVIATIPAGIVGVLLKHFENQLGGMKLLIAFNLAVFGIILYLVDRKAKVTVKKNQIGFVQSFWIGCSQALALIPGVSRSGITITASRALGLDRETGARYSFLLSTPAVLGAFVLSLKDIQSINSSFVFGVLSSFVFGLIAIKYLLKYLEKGNFAIFMYYRILLAAIIAVLFFLR